MRPTYRRTAESSAAQALRHARLCCGECLAGRARGEMHRLREIIGLGYNPNSLIRPRRNFTDRIIRSAEDI